MSADHRFHSFRALFHLCTYLQETGSPQCATFRALFVLSK